jgi:hypothetical protein
MKRKFFITFASFAIVILTFCSSECSASSNSGLKKAESASKAHVASSQEVVPVPTLRYYPERRTIGRWATHWDRPDMACYVYLISYGNIIGYYISDGKPAATGSLLTPEYFQSSYATSGVVIEHQLSDIDGTYGSNNPGIRFFTANGIAVEWAGEGVSYIYSDVPLKLNVPLLGE